MSLATATITYDISDLVGADFDARRTKIWVTTNIADSTIVDTDAALIRVGDGLGTIADDGTGSVQVWIPGDSNPETWQTYLHLDYAERRPGAARVQRTFGPFTVTEDTDLAYLIPEQEVPPTYLSQVTDELQTYVDSASDSADAAEQSHLAAEALVLSDLGTTDGQTRALIENPASQTAVVLAGSFASRAALRQGGSTAAKTNRKLAVLMMDDGYLTDLTVVKPILDSLGITKCTLGINTANVNVAGSVPNHLTWAQIRTLVSAGWEMANHGATHADLVAANAALVKSEITNAHATALTNGVTFRSMIWAFHHYNALALAEARRLYPAAAGGFGNLSYADGAAPIGTYALSRPILNDSTTLADAKAVYDTAVSTTSLATVFGHSDTGLGLAAQTVLHDSLAYALSLGFEFVTLSEAIAAVGNPVEAGDLITGTQYTVITRDGRLISPTLPANVVAGDDLGLPLASDPPTSYDDGKMSFNTTFGGSGGWPVSGAANIVTNRVRSHGSDAYTTQQYVAPNGDVYSRRAASTTTWSAWSGPYQAATHFVAPSGLGLSSNYDAWPVGTSIVGAVAGGPGGVNGTLVNTRVQASASNPQLYSVQFFHDYGGSTGAVWRRMSTGATSWSTWTVLPQVTTGTAAPGTTPKYVGQQFIDTTGKKVYVATGTASSADWSVLN